MVPAMKVCLGCCRQALLQNTEANCEKCREENHPKLTTRLFKEEKERKSVLFWLERVNFLPRIRYSAVFWIQCEDNVDNTLMFSVVAK